MDEAAVRKNFHDLNNALSVILTGAELISGGTEEESQIWRDAQSVRDAAIRARESVATLRSQLGLP